MSGQLYGYRSNVILVSGQLYGYRSNVILVSGQLYGYRSNPLRVPFQKLTSGGYEVTMHKLSGW